MQFFLRFWQRVIIQHSNSEMSTIVNRIVLQLTIVTEEVNSAPIFKTIGFGKVSLKTEAKTKESYLGRSKWEKNDLNDQIG